MLEFIKETFERLIAELSITTTRYLYPSFNVSNRLTGIVGPRGVGKTTLLLQYIKEHLYQERKVIYFSADLVYFQNTNLLEFVTELYQNEGYRYFFIDEIHKYENWNQELKNLYDAFPSIHIIFSGSSMLDLVKGTYDLSRRAKLYNLQGLSFREYLNFQTQASIEPITFKELLSHPEKLMQTIAGVEKIKGYFKEYLEMGYYPFVFEDKHSYYERVSRIIDKTIFEDIANFYNLKTPNLHLFKRILSYLASIPPGEVNTNNIANNLGVANQTVFHFLTILNDVGLIRFIYPYATGSQNLRKPQKIFLHNTTLLYTLEQYLSNPLDKGLVRELFFLQSLQDAGVNVFHSLKGDYRTEDTLFEIGGKNKTKEQLRTSEIPGFVVKDDILVPSKEIIPLLYFGFLY